MKLVWPESFVEETNLSHHISVLRSTLGENGETFIETVPRRGYRFVAPVREQFEDSPAGIDTSTQADPVLARGYFAGRRLLWLAGAIVALCAVAVPVWRSAGVGDGGAAVLRAVPLTSYPGMEFFPTFSPDGSQVAFSWLKQGQIDTDIYVQQVDGQAPLRLTDDSAHDWTPSWSPDGKWIAFVRFTRTGPSALFVTPALPGTAKKVTDLFVRFVRGWLFTGTGVAWSPDSKWIVVTDFPSPNEPSLSLILVSAETGERRRLTTPPRGNVMDGAPAFAPDSRSLAFIRTQNLESREILVIQLSDDLRPIEPATQLTSMRRFVGSPVWTADGRHLLFLAGDKMKGEQLWKIRVPDPGARPGQPELIPAPFEASSLLAIRFRGDGTARLAYMRHSLNPNIWAVDLKDQITPAQAPRTLIASTLEDYNPQFSPDGNSIVFQSYRSGNPEIWRSDRDGLKAVQLTSFKGPYTGWPRWSPDGRWIVFHSAREGNSDVFVMKSDGGMPKRLSDDPANDSMASWSQDGHWIYFASDRSRVREVWKMRFEPDLRVSPAPPIQVTKGGGGISQESLDGKLLYYGKGPGTGVSLWSVPLGGGEERQVLSFAPYASFVERPEGIYFLAGSAPGVPGKILFRNSVTGKISTVVGLDGPSFMGLSLSPDGRRLLFTHVDSEESDLMMVDNWRP